jgi:hypothetical protein
MDFIDMLPIAPRLHEPLRTALRGEASDWPDLNDYEARSLVVHGVAPLVYSVARVPALRTEAIRAAALEALRLDDVREVLDALATAGVDALILKGTSLAYDLYTSPELRPRGDTDLLIAAHDLEHARACFAALGFEEQPRVGDEHGTRQTAFMRAGASGVVHMYDVHWAVANTPLFASALTFDDLRGRARAVPCLGPHARGLSDVDALLLACIHRVAHHHDSDRVIWLVDIALLRDRMSRAEHERFWRAAADARIVGACVRSIERAEEWMSRPPANRAEEWLSRAELEREEPSRAFLDRDITQGGVLVANLRALPWRARVERLWQVAFPPAAFVQQSFGTRSRLVLPWLYVRRGARGLLRLFRRVGA